MCHLDKCRVLIYTHSVIVAFWSVSRTSLPWKPSLIPLRRGQAPKDLAPNCSLAQIRGPMSSKRFFMFATAWKKIIEIFKNINMLINMWPLFASIWIIHLLSFYLNWASKRSCQGSGKEGEGVAEALPSRTSGRVGLLRSLRRWKRLICLLTMRTE